MLLHVGWLVQNSKKDNPFPEKSSQSNNFLELTITKEESSTDRDLKLCDLQPTPSQDEMEQKTNRSDMGKNIVWCGRASAVTVLYIYCELPNIQELILQ